MLPYHTLAAALDEPLPAGASVRGLEDFLIAECFGTARRGTALPLLTWRALTRRIIAPQGLIKGKLDQRRRCLEARGA